MIKLRRIVMVLALLVGVTITAHQAYAQSPPDCPFGNDPTGQGYDLLEQIGGQWTKITGYDCGGCSATFLNIIPTWPMSVGCSATGAGPVWTCQGYGPDNSTSWKYFIRNGVYANAVVDYLNDVNADVAKGFVGNYVICQNLNSPMAFWLRSNARP